MPRVATSTINDWVSQPDLHRSIHSYFRRESEQSSEFKLKYACDQLLSKYADPSPASAAAREQAAYDKLLSTELRNAETNWRLRYVREHVHVLHVAANYINDCLGRFDIEELYLSADFSNGASQSRCRREADKFSKFNSRSHVTREALPYLLTLFRSSKTLMRLDTYGSFVSDSQLSTGNELFTVPKSDVIDRVCAKEPDWNMYFQKGLGKMIRQRLKRVNIDLNDQSINKDLARIGSLKNNLATLDLSSASDSITTELVYKLMPTDWFKHLDTLRCPLGTLPDGRTVKWQLFSTMGNGFTFELESLIFWALAKAICYTFGIKGRVSVYGDDIIVPSAAATPLIELLEYCGFKTNTDKTFIEGPFRESCGGHYYNGLDVTPFYIKAPILDVTDLVLVCNKLRKWCAQDSGLSVDDFRSCDPRFFELFEELVSHIPNAHLITGGPIELSSRYIAGPGIAKYHLKQKARKKRPRQLEAYQYWLTKRKCEPLTTGKAREMRQRRREVYHNWLTEGRREPLTTELSIAKDVRLVPNRDYSINSAPVFCQEVRETIEGLHF